MSPITIKVEPLMTSEERRQDTVTGPGTAAPIVGFRNWRIMRGGPRSGELSSPFIPIAWPEPVLRAECRRFGCAEDLLQAPHAAPEPACGCGICAYHAPTGDFSKVDFLGVSGIVTVWGRIVADTGGMRAEHARVVALGLYSRWGRHQRQAVREIADRLGVDLVDLPELGAAARDYGETLPPSVHPPAATRISGYGG